VYFEPASVIVALVLLGQVLELRARSQTSSALKALLGLVPNTARIVRQDGVDGDQSALERLTPIVHKELHRLASRYMRGERPGHSLQATALVNEAYMRPPYVARETCARIAANRSEA
jgi:hypothetical protein